MVSELLRVARHDVCGTGAPVQSLRCTDDKAALSLTFEGAARKRQVAPERVERVIAVLSHALARGAKRGHTFLTGDALELGTCAFRAGGAGAIYCYVVTLRTSARCGRGVRTRG